MKKTIWLPIVLGVGMGLLAGIATVTGLSFIVSGSNTSNAIGIYSIFLLISAALGGPLASAITPALWLVISAFYGPPAMKEVLSDPITFWTNIIALGIYLALVSFVYRVIYERVSTPWRFFYWAATVVVFYLLALPSSITPQFYLSGSTISEILPAVRSGYLTYIPQVIFDIVITSLVFVALPPRYRRPLWYEASKAPDQSAGIQSAKEDR